MSIRHKTQLNIKIMKTAEKKQLIKEVIENERINIDNRRRMLEIVRC